MNHRIKFQHIQAVRSAQPSYC